MSRTRGSVRTPSPASAAPASDGPEVVPAIRPARPGWRDPRLWVGVAIVAASVLLGAKVVGDADDSIAVWAVTADLGPGDEVGAEDVVARSVRFVQSSDANRYLSADEPLPVGARVSRDVGAGELLPRAALGTDDQEAQQAMTFEFEGAGIPHGLAQGDRVDVFVTSGASGAEARTATAPPLGTRVLRGLVVTAVTGADAGLGATTTRSVTVGVPAEAPATGLAAAVQAAKTDSAFLVEQG